MNPLGTTIEQLLETDINKLEAMTDAELDAYFEEALKIQPTVQMMQPVADAESRHTVSLRGARGGTPLRKQTRSEFTLEPQSKLGKEMSKADKAKAKLAALEQMMKGLE